MDGLAGFAVTHRESLNAVIEDPAAQALEVLPKTVFVTLDLELIKAVVDCPEVSQVSLGRDLALVQDDHVGAKGFDIGQDVGGDQDLDILGRGDILDKVQDFLSSVRIKIGRGLVQKEEPGIVDEPSSSPPGGACPRARRNTR